MKVLKNVILFVLFFTTINSFAQTIEPFGGNVGPNVYLKDLDNVRNNFVGTWQYSSGNKEFVLHIYKDDMRSQGSWFGQGEFWADELMGNYIYKENGLIIINSTQYMPTTQNYTIKPFGVFTTDGIHAKRHGFLVDFGTVLTNNNCETYFKPSSIEMVILNPEATTLQASLKLTGIPKKITLGNTNCATWIDGYSIPTIMILTKISNTPPPLN
jgi:hypothetical protein